MAYGLKYVANWVSRSGLEGVLNILEESYLDAPLTITLKGFDKSALALEQKFKDWEEGVLGRTLSFTIINTFSNFYVLLPLLTATERQYRVILSVTAPSSESKLLFEGYLNTGLASEKMLQNQEIHLTASTYLSKLNNYTTELVENIQDNFFINLIFDILNSIGEYDLRVNSSIWTVSPFDAGHTFLDKTGIDMQVFWEDNVTRKNNLEILQMILKSFNCFLYWKKGYWYIERFDDLWDTTVTYVQYDHTQEYDAAKAGIVITEVRNLFDIQDLMFLNTSQTLSVNPGYKTVKINLNTDQHLLLNLINPDFPPVSDIPDISSGGVPIPALRGWEKESNFIWADGGYPYVMSNAIKRTGLGIVENSDTYQGLYTRFRFGVSDEQTTLTFEFSYYAKIPTDSNGGTVPSTSDYSFEFNWWLRESGSNHYIVYDETEEKYKRLDWGSSVDLTYAVNNTEKVSWSSFDEDTKVYKVRINVLVGDLYALNTNQDFVFAICIPRVYDSNGNSIYFDGSGSLPPGMEQFGDVKIVVNNPVNSLNNEIIGTTNSLFLNKKEIDIDLADISNVSYTNGILTGPTLFDRTVTWGNSDSVLHPLIDWLMIDKFRMYNVSRQKISGTVFRKYDLELFDLFEDRNQPYKKFILVGYTYHPVFDSYDIDLWEFDTDTVINLVE